MIEMNSKPPPRPESSEQMKLDPRIDAMIGAKLRSFYDGLMAEPVPDRILDLVGRLDAK